MVAFGAMTLAFLELLAMSEIKKKLDANLGKGADFQSIYDYTTGVLYMFALGHKSEGKGGVKEILEAPLLLLLLLIIETEELLRSVVRF